MSVVMQSVGMCARRPSQNGDGRGGDGRAGIGNRGSADVRGPGDGEAETETGPEGRADEAGLGHGHEGGEENLEENESD